MAFSDYEYEEMLDSAYERAQDRADETGATQYVIETFDGELLVCDYYGLESSDTIIETIYPEEQGGYL